MTDIFKDKTAEMPSWWERPARTALDATETVNLAKLPGSYNVPGRAVEHVPQVRRGHDY